jgi:queuine tRNA-ribosyltransferase
MREEAFRIRALDRETRARLGRLETAHGDIETPAFLPVATKGGVKTLSAAEVSQIGVQALIANAFLLSLKPGLPVLEKAGGLHRFMGWEGSLFTDSGGYQILRKDFLLAIGKKGITFRSPFDRSRRLLTPEGCIEIQERMGSDVAMILDDCPPFGSSYEREAESVARTASWAKTCSSLHQREDQLLFGIVQGGTFPDLRGESARELAALGFDGYGIGGLSIGESKAEMARVLDATIPYLPEEKPRYLMGLGSPVELLGAVSQGIDLFDSAFPTRNARHNTAYTPTGPLPLRKARFSEDFLPLEEGCPCPACRESTRAYIHHLLRVDEPLGARLLTLHNLSFFQRLMAGARKAIRRGEFETFRGEFLLSYT